MRNPVYEDIIGKAEIYLGDIMGEFAECNHENEGGALGMVEGRFEMSDDDIEYCMGDAILQVIGYNSDLDVSQIVRYWKETGGF